MANISKSVKLRGLPAEAEYGLSSAFYYLFAAIVFLIPTSLVAAELAAMFQDKQGGVFRWVGEAYGKKWGFLAIFLQWVESTIWYPTVLTFERWHWHLSAQTTLTICHWPPTAITHWLWCLSFTGLPLSFH